MENSAVKRKESSDPDGFVANIDEESKSLLPGNDEGLLFPDESGEADFEKNTPWDTAYNITGSLLGSHGLIFVIFSIYSSRIFLLPWLWNGTGLSFFLPVLSPVYRQGEHWQEQCERFAIIFHVLFGVLMLACAMAQFDKTLRKGNPTFHRWSGRAYVFSGAVSLSALYFLRSSMGAGSSRTGRSKALVAFVDVTTFFWALSTTLAVVAAMRRQFELHRDAMSLSMCMSLAPIAQRVMSWAVLAPAAMIVRYSYCVVSSSGPGAWQWPWQVRWGPPGGTSSLLWGTCELQSSQTYSLILGAGQLTGEVYDPRARPPVLSLDGYGEGEQASLALSAWAGLVVLLAVGAPPLIGRCLGVHTDDKIAKDVLAGTLYTDGIASKEDVTQIDQCLKEAANSQHSSKFLAAPGICEQAYNDCSVFMGTVSHALVAMVKEPLFRGDWFGTLHMGDTIRLLASALNTFIAYCWKSLAGLLKVSPQDMLATSPRPLHLLLRAAFSLLFFLAVVVVFASVLLYGVGATVIIAAILVLLIGGPVHLIVLLCSGLGRLLL